MCGAIAGLHLLFLFLDPWSNTEVDSVWCHCRATFVVSVLFKDFSRLLSDFPVLFKADLIFKDFSRKPSKFKYFSSLCKPWLSKNP